jgi:hypothetical protein
MDRRKNVCVCVCVCVCVYGQMAGYMDEQWKERDKNNDFWASGSLTATWSLSYVDKKMLGVRW